MFNKRAQEGKLMLEMNRNVSNQKAKQVLNWQPLGTIEETILATLASMDQQHLI